MAKMGDLLAKLAEGHDLSAAEVDAVRRGLNEAQDATATIKSWSMPGGAFDPNLFSHSATPFSILPHEAASIGFTTQSIANRTLTVPTGDAASGATWSYGMTINPANATVSVFGVPAQSLVLVVALAQWEYNTSGIRYLRWEATDGTGAVDDTKQAFDQDPFSETSGTFPNRVAHIRRVPSSPTDYRIQVYQSSGGALNLSFGYLAMYRLR